MSWTITIGIIRPVHWIARLFPTERPGWNMKCYPMQAIKLLFTFHRNFAVWSHPVKQWNPNKALHFLFMIAFSKCANLHVNVTNCSYLYQCEKWYEVQRLFYDLAQEFLPGIDSDICIWRLHTKQALATMSLVVNGQLQFHTKIISCIQNILLTSWV